MHAKRLIAVAGTMMLAAGVLTTAPAASGAPAPADAVVAPENPGPSPILAGAPAGADDESAVADSGGADQDATGADPTDWGENLVTGGGFESPMAVGDNPDGWKVIGLDTNPVTVTDVGAAGSAQSVLVPGRGEDSGSALAGLAWEFYRPMQKLKIEFSFAVPETGNARSLEFWTRAPGVTGGVSQITLNYTDHRLVQVQDGGGKATIASGLLSSDPSTTDGMNWYRIRMITDQDGGEVKFWLSGPNGPLPDEGDTPVTTGTWSDNTPFGSINLGFNHMYAPSYYWVDEVDVRGVPVPDPGPEEGSLDPFDGTALVSNSDFELDAVGAEPAGWTQWPLHRYDTRLGVRALGSAGTAQAVRVRGAGAARQEGLAWLFDEPQAKIQTEFSVAYTDTEHGFDFWTGGQSHYGGPSQAELRLSGNTLQHHAYGLKWRDIATLTPSVDTDGDGTLEGTADEVHWNHLRVITTKGGGYLAVWVGDATGGFGEEPTAVLHVANNNESIGSVVFGYGSIPSAATYYLDDVTVRGLVDDHAGASPDLDRHPIWDGLEGPRTGADAPEIPGMTWKTIHAPGCLDPDDPVYPVCRTDVEVDGYYPSFLHGAAIAEHNGVLWATWENGPHENSEWGMQRGRYSLDWGETWSAPVVIAPDPDYDPETGKTGPYGRSHGAFIEQDGHLYAFVESFRQHDSTALFKADLHAELWVVDEADHTWSLVNDRVLDNVWPLAPPRKMDNGNYLVAGVTKDYGPAVAISNGDDITAPWTTVVLDDARTDPRKWQYHYSEPTTWVDGSTVTMIMRNEDAEGNYRAAGYAVSHDYGQTWETLSHVRDIDLDKIVAIPQMLSNLPMTTANIFAGKLSTGQRYLISNIRNRSDINILLSRPGEDVLSHSLLIHGDAPPKVGTTTGGQYNQPYAIERTSPVDGEKYLLVVYSDAKQRAEFVKIPVASLTVESPALAEVSLPTGLEVAPGGSVQLPASGTRVDGLPLDLEHAQVTYHSDHPELVAFDEGTMTIAGDIGAVQSVSVWADATFGLDPVTSTPVTVWIQPPDVHRNNPYYDDLHWALTNGIARVDGEGMLQPFGRVNKADLAAFFWRTSHPGEADPVCDAAVDRMFRDVPATDTRCGMIEWAAEQGAVSGKNRRVFGTNLVIDRGDLAAELFGWVNPDAQDPTCTAPHRAFSDVPAGNSRCGAIEWLAAVDLARGYPDGTFHPNELVTRQSALAFVRSAAELRD